MSPQKWIFVGAISTAVAIALGAVGAHGIENWLRDNFEAEVAAKRLAQWATGTEYHRFHSIGLIVIGILLRNSSAGRPAKLLNIAGWLMIAGILMFSVALYVYAIAGYRWLGPVFPLGGFSYIVAWLLVACAYCCPCETPA